MMYGTERQMHVEDDAQAADDQMLPTFYCRALYDYQSADGSSLTFYRGDIIEVLTQLESGWWDGLLGEERGWFPSNYVQPISDAEAEAELGTQDLMRASEVHDSAIDVSQRGRMSEQDRDWLRDGNDYGDKKHVVESYSRDNNQHVGAANDFWLPQVDASGQVYLMCASQGFSLIRALDFLCQLSDWREI